MIATHTVETKRPFQPHASPVTARAGLLQRKCACGGSAGPSGECEECKRIRARGLQAKLRVNEPEDEFEREADRAADAVVSGVVSTRSGLPEKSMIRRR